MNNLKTLIGYEYKKIFIRKSTWITFLFAVGITLLSCFGDLMGNVYIEGKPVYTHYQEMKTDRAYARALAGREVGDTLIGEMQEAYGYVPDVPLYSATEEYRTYARPYSPIYHLVRSVLKYTVDETVTPGHILKFDATDYYKQRDIAVHNILNKENLTGLEIKKLLKMNEKVKNPFTFYYTDGYHSIMTRMYTIGIILFFTIIICLAPVFANEYYERTDQLLLTTRYGKNKGILAKLSAGISFGIGICFVILLTQIVPTLLIYGTDGWNAQIQIINATTAYHFNVLQSVLILCGMTVTASILISCISLYLSAKLKNSFGVVVILGSFIILCLFLHVPQQYRILYQLVNALPMNLMKAEGTFSDYFFIFFGKCFTVYQAVPTIYGLIAAILLKSSFKSFKNHQIS
ncbi:hypothetical protein [Anaerocolumna sp. MB42-C2]|uniref:hypothetical protein n=1 Tax=Anaerocolumna sp. MB42-C2 TaxID=3070997 RepID=UPI0027E173E4|nr:hypothetical protein [Anaerocolumna sp. MB42-C2]WMJ89952.1 hypothetical protein RBU59_10630 [Anaerocolumna sp. MB42-C2]